MHPSRNDIGAFIDPDIGVTPRAPTASATAINGSAIDRTGFDSCVLAVFTGATAGTPDSFSVAGKLQHSDTTTDGDFSDFTGASITAITAAGTLAEVDVNLADAKQYVRAVVTPTYVGGSTPSVQLGALVIKGGARNPPV
jgi:hypothetical protein